MQNICFCEVYQKKNILLFVPVFGVSANQNFYFFN